MPILIAILAIVGGAYFWMNRAKGAAEMTGELMEAANDVRLAARRFGFRRRMNQHPVDGIEDEKLAIGGLAVAFLELDSYPTAEQRSAMLLQMQSAFDINAEEAEELAILGRWFVTECGGATPAIARLSRRLVKMSGNSAIEPLMQVIKGIAEKGDTGLSQRQTDALDDVKLAFRIS